MLILIHFKEKNSKFELQTKDCIEMENPTITF